MAYDYYRQSQPQMWGTQQYQMPAAPMVGYQPQAGWGGMDYYRAHTRWNDVEEDDDIFERISRGVRRFVGNAGSNSEEAAACHQRVYSGWVDMRAAMPEVIGAAAGYEALRFWETNQGLRGPVMEDAEREEDAIIGLAIAEAGKLWGYTGRLWADRGRRESCEEAAATVHKIFRRNHRGLLRYDTYNSLTGDHNHRYDDYDDEYERPSLRRRRSFATLSGDIAGYDGYERSSRASFGGGLGGGLGGAYGQPLAIQTGYGGGGLQPGYAGSAVGGYGQPLISPVQPMMQGGGYISPSPYLTPGFQGAGFPSAGFQGAGFQGAAYGAPGYGAPGYGGAGYPGSGYGGRF